MIEEIFVDEESVAKEIIEEDVLAKKEEIKSKFKFEDVVFNRRFKVFAKINNNGYITDIDSDLNLKDTTGWILIDEGVGDKYAYPQTMYFDEPIIDEDGNYRFKV